MITEFKIVWKCGHQWRGTNNTKRPNRFEETKKFGCPYCREKRIKEAVLGTKIYRGLGNFVAKIIEV